MYVCTLDHCVVPILAVLVNGSFQVTTSLGAAPFRLSPSSSQIGWLKQPARALLNRERMRYMHMIIHCTVLYCNRFTSSKWRMNHRKLIMNIFVPDAGSNRTADLRRQCAVYTLWLLCTSGTGSLRILWYMVSYLSGLGWDVEGKLLTVIAQKCANSLHLNVLWVGAETELGLWNAAKQMVQFL